MATNATAGNERRPRWDPPGSSNERRSDGSGRRTLRPGDGRGRPFWCRNGPIGGDGGGRDRRVVRRPERDLLDRDGGGRGDDGADDTQPERLGGRETERPVDALDDGRDGGLSFGRERLREDLRQVADSR